MRIKEVNKNHHIIQLSDSDIESAIRQFICTCHPQFAKDFVVNPLFDRDKIVKATEIYVNSTYEAYTDKTQRFK